MLMQVGKQCLREVERLLAAGMLQCQVYLPIGPHVGHVGFHAVARVYILEYLVAVDKSGVRIVYDGLEAQIRLLPDEYLHLVASLVGRLVLAQVALHFGRGHHAVALLVDGDVHYVRRAYLHALLLLAERAE